MLLSEQSLQSVNYTVEPLRFAGLLEMSCSDHDTAESRSMEVTASVILSKQIRSVLDFTAKAEPTQSFSKAKL